MEGGTVRIVETTHPHKQETTKDTTMNTRQILSNKSNPQTSNLGSSELGNAIDSGIGLSITIDNLRVFINKTLSILSAYQ